MGLPSVMTTDQGKEFLNQVNDELMKTFGIDHRLTTAYHPQANGLDERYNQTLVNALSKFAQTDRDSWDEKLGVVCTYDSMYPSVSTIVKSQIAALLATKNKEIKLRFMDVQKQSGGYDCGVFAIAFATALAHGINPGKYLFNQHVMRKHHLKCIEMVNITMFPVLKIRRAEDRMKSEDAFEIYCTCRMPEYPDVDMIQCCKCSE